LFSSARSNPTVGTLSEVAAALGMTITLEPLDEAEREQITVPLLEGRSADTAALVERLGEMRVRATA
jgi:hypothetical protein